MRRALYVAVGFTFVLTMLTLWGTSIVGILYLVGETGNYWLLSLLLVSTFILCFTAIAGIDKLAEWLL